MRIFYDHQIFSLQDAGGASRYFYELARHLGAIDGPRLEIALGLNSSVYPFRKIANADTRIFERRVTLSPGVPRYILNEIISNIVGFTRGRFDIYHSTLYRTIPLLRRRRTVVTHHDCTHELFPHLFRNAAMIIESKRRLYAAADAIICVSEASRRDLLRFYSVAEERTRVIYHGFAPFLKPVNDQNQTYGESLQYILFVGARGAYKNFMALLEAYTTSGAAVDYELVAVGGGEFVAAELEKINQLGIMKRIKLIPKATDEVLAATYKNAALLVYPSLYEGFGFPPLEAMSMGCPVLTANTSSMPEVCGEAAFYFDPKDPEALRCALERALSDAEGTERKKDMGYQQVARYRWERTADETLNLYRRVLE
jgi:glycosyltransferase involved in cell wall biosynthesis